MWLLPAGLPRRRLRPGSSQLTCVVGAVDHSSHRETQGDAELRTGGTAASCGSRRRLRPRRWSTDGLQAAGSQRRPAPPREGGSDTGCGLRSRTRPDAIPRAPAPPDPTPSSHPGNPRSRTPRDTGWNRITDAPPARLRPHLASTSWRRKRRTRAGHAGICVSSAHPASLRLTSRGGAGLREPPLPAAPPSGAEEQHHPPPVPGTTERRRRTRKAFLGGENKSKNHSF